MSRYIIIAVGVLISLIVQILSYSKISEKEIKKIEIKDVIFIDFMVLLFAVNSYMNYSFSRLIISFLLMNITYYYVFRDNIKDCFIRSAIIYIILLLVEVILSVVIVNSGIESLVELNSEEITKFIFSIVNCLVAYMIVKIKWIKRISNKIIEKIRNKEVITVVIIVVLISFMLISHKYAISEYDYKLYKINISLLICYMCLFSIVIYEEYKRNILKAEQEAILRYMKSYEGIVDESNMKLHEVHNEVIILKSYKDRNSEEYNKMLDEMEKKYSKVGQTYKNINKLPEGIKGIIYYKIDEMKSEKIKVGMYIPKKIGEVFEEVVEREYVEISKIISILLDNAKEAAKESEEKEVNIDFEEKNKEIIMRIENTYKNAPEIDKLYEKGYTTKGIKRGYGLYILKRLIEKTEGVKLKQDIENNMFVSTLYINKNANKKFNHED